jgi:hypothetical protein
VLLFGGQITGVDEIPESSEWMSKLNKQERVLQPAYQQSNEPLPTAAAAHTPLSADIKQEPRWRSPFTMSFA